jgi:hypothetical protein
VSYQFVCWGIVPVYNGADGFVGRVGFMRPFMEGADGLRLMSFHLQSYGMRVVLQFMVFVA